MAKRISEKQRKEIIDDFINNKSLEEISKKFNFTKLTISRHLKKSLGEVKYSEINKSSKTDRRFSESNQLDKTKGISNIVDGLSTDSSTDNDLFTNDSFFEIEPIDLDIDTIQQKDLSSVSIKEVELPKIVYIVVDKEIELQTKLLREFVEWHFLSEKDLNRKTIEIFYDLKSAKRSSTKEQRVIKVPNSNVFKITAPILLSRGISRIVSSEVLIALWWFTTFVEIELYKSPKYWATNKACSYYETYW